jgi:hypothetical protein
LTFERAADGSVSGSFNYDKDKGRDQVNFTVSADGLAGFWLEDEPEENLLTVDYRTPDNPRIFWSGQTLDGMGPLSAEESTGFSELAMSDMVFGLAMIPLDIACQPEGMVDPLQAAALLYPLQLRFKYQIGERVASANMYSILSVCNYGEENDELNLNPSLIMMSPSSPVPVVFGYFPFDAEGAIEKTAGARSGYKMAALDPKWLGDDPYGLRQPSLASFGTDPIRDEWGPCEAKCRGACGSDCTMTNCKLRVDDRCEKNVDGKNDGFRSLYFVYACGIHPACIEHDACYDACNRYYGCETFGATVCMHTTTGVTMPIEALSGSYLSCDSQVLATEGPQKAKDWMRGYGPFTATQVFEYSDPQNRYEYDPVSCPLDEAAQPQEQVAEPEQPKPEEPVEPIIVPEEETSPEEPEVINTIPVGVYLGEIEFNPELLEYAQSVTSDVTIIVAEDGTVTGSFTAQIVDTPYSYDPYSYQWTMDFSGTFSGSLTNTSGTIQSEEYYNFWVDTNDPLQKPSSGYFTRDVDITISGEQLIGITGVRPDAPDEPMFIFKFITEKFV